MRRITFVLMLATLALAAGCGKKSGPTGPPPPSDAAFAENSVENTLAWLAAQRNALDAAGDKDAAEKFKALVETMKGRRVDWNATLDWTSADKTYGLTAYTLNTDAPEPKSAEKRERHYVLVCKPVEPGVPIPETAPLVRKQDRGFPSAAGDWHRDARAGLPVKLTGTIAGVQLHRNSWVTGMGASDRVVHTEVGVTLHIADGGLAPAK